MRDWAAANLPYNPAKWETYKQPLIAQPGEDWNYGISMDWAGKVLEAVTGVSIAQYCNDHIFAPLGISDITFNRVRVQVQ